MIRVRRTVGRSMMPTLKQGQILVFVKSKKFATNDIVLASVDGRDVVKRAMIKNDQLTLVGDNSKESAVFKNVKRSKVYGKLVYPQR